MPPSITGVVVLMLSLFAVILTSLIGNLLALSRLLYAAGREGEDASMLEIFTRADHIMYRRKNALKDRIRQSN